MGYTSININYSEDTLCEEISFTEPGEQSYAPGDVITLSDKRLSRNRSLIVMNVNYTEEESSGLSTTVSGFSTEYKYTRKAPNCDISFFTMTHSERSDYQKENSRPDSEVFFMLGNEYGVGGWSMHSIIQKIAEWMGLKVRNNLPDYWISDFSISLGSTFFEALNGLVSEFEPLIVLINKTLYILERNGAGMLSGGGITPVGFTNRAVDGEYTPAPGCIKVEGGEGKYIPAKDPTIPHYICPDPPCISYYVGVSPPSNYYVGGSETPDNSITFHNITEKYAFTSEGDKVLIYRRQILTFVDVDGHRSHTGTSATYTYNKLFILEKSVETCSAEIAGELRVYNKIYTRYEHDRDWILKGQITSRYELFIFNGTDYVRYDTRDYDLEDLAVNESFELMPAEIRTTRYSEVDTETYGVSTVVASKVWNTDKTEWQTSFVFEHDIVEAGSLQKNTRVTGKTLQVYAGDCPVFPKNRYKQSDPALPGYKKLKVFDEPAKVFSISTPDWESIEDCYVYLAALVSGRFQKATANTPLIDPLPLMGINGLGSIIEDGIKGGYYVRGYTINIDPNSGYTTGLNLEARKDA